jgi:hypothetical protein
MRKIPKICSSLNGKKKFQPVPKNRKIIWVIFLVKETLAKAARKK